MIFQYCTGFRSAVLNFPKRKKVIRVDSRRLVVRDNVVIPPSPLN